VVAGIVAYVLGRSRRNAFVSCLFGITLSQVVQWVINLAQNTPSILGLGVGGAFGTYVVAILISVAVSEFLGRCFESATIQKEEKIFNYETHTYDSKKNGKLKIKKHTENDIKNSLTKSKNAKSSKNNAKMQNHIKNNEDLLEENI